MLSLLPLHNRTTVSRAPLLLLPQQLHLSLLLCLALPLIFPFPQSAPVPQRLAHDRVGQLEDRIKDDPKADTDAWMSLIAYYKEKDQPDNVRKVYERFLAVFPSAVCIFRTDYHDLAKCTH
jgi:hypothetical protein